MKKLTYIFACFAVLSIFSLSSCSSDKTDSDSNSDTTIVQLEEKMDQLESTETDSTVTNSGTKLGKEYTAKYICPNHCKGSGSDKQGECSHCEMELIENPAFVKN